MTLLKDFYLYTWESTGLDPMAGALVGILIAAYIWTHLHGDDDR